MADENENENDSANVNSLGKGMDFSITDEAAEKLLADPSDEDTAKQHPDADPLGERGQRAIEAMKEQRKAARAERDTARKELDELRKKLSDHENQGKSELQRLQEAAESGKTRAERAESALKRREIAETRAPEHATVAQIKAVAKRLAGESDDDLEADADELFALLAPTPTAPKTPSRPKERLRGGSEPDEPVEETSPRKLAELIPRGHLR